MKICEQKFPTAARDIAPRIAVQQTVALYGCLLNFKTQTSVNFVTEWYNCMFFPSGAEVWWKTLLTQEDPLPCPSDEECNPFDKTSVCCHVSLVWRCTCLGLSVGLLKASANPVTQPKTYTPKTNPHTTSPVMEDCLFSANWATIGPSH